MRGQGVGAGETGDGEGTDLAIDVGRLALGADGEGQVGAAALPDQRRRASMGRHPQQRGSRALVAGVGVGVAGPERDPVAQHGLGLGLHAGGPGALEVHIALRIDVIDLVTDGQAIAGELGAQPPAGRAPAEDGVPAQGPLGLQVRRRARRDAFETGIRSLEDRGRLEALADVAAEAEAAAEGEHRRAAGGGLAPVAARVVAAEADHGGQARGGREAPDGEAREIA